MRTLDVQHGIQLKNILFLTDFSEAADVAGQYAASLAKSYGAKLIALHVYPAVSDPATPPAAWDQLEQIAKSQAEETKNDLETEFTGIKAEALVREGELWPHVAIIVEQQKTDLIVMGTHGRSGLRRLLLGSVAEEIFRRAECPVLTVGPGVHRQIKSPCEFARILFATDFSDAGNAAAPYAISLAQEHQARLTLVHVIEDAKTGDLVAAHELAASDEALLRKLLPPEAEQWCEPDFVIERGNPAERILDVAARRHADLIVIGARKARGFPGASTHLPIAVAHEIVAKAQCPVLNVRA